MLSSHSARLTGPWLCRLTVSILASTLCGLLAACGSATPGPRDRSATVQAESCAEAASKTTGAIATRIYGEVAGGRIVSEAIRRLQRSSSLIAAVEQDDPQAAQRALNGLVQGQIVRASVRHGGHVLASFGARWALAPSTVELLNPARQQIGSVTVSTQVGAVFVKTLANLMASQVVIFRGEHQLMSSVAGAHFSAAAIPNSGAVSVGGQTFEAHSMNGTGFPNQHLRIVLLTPASALRCVGDATQTTVAVIGRVAMHIYRDEQSSSEVARIVAHMERSPVFVQAVADRDVPATRNAIIGFFRNRTHVVRVRVTVAGKLLVDVGGSRVLAPLEGTLRVGGRVVGHFLTAIQDDAGYLKLAHRFTGAQVLMRVGPEQVRSTLGEESARLGLPDRGTITYRGVTYGVYSFFGRAFPTGKLHIGLLIPSG